MKETNPSEKALREAKITHGYLESNGWSQSSGNTFFKNGLKLWLWDKWTLEVCPKTSSEKIIVLAKDIKCIDELNSILN